MWGQQLACASRARYLTFVQCFSGFTGADGGSCSAEVSTSSTQSPTTSSNIFTTTALTTVPASTPVIFAGSMASADVDGDGSISAIELKNFTRSYGGQGIFSSVDIDDSGRISSDEFYAYARSLAAADSDGDGILSGAEIAQYTRVYGGSGSIDTLDIDESGSISQVEFDAYTGSMASADNDGSESVSQSEFLRFASLYAVNATFASLDVDGDASISSSEFDLFFQHCQNATGLVGTCQCLPGFTGPLGGPCFACSLGSYKALEGSSPCLNCEQAKYADVQQSTGCSSCPANSLSPAASRSHDDCVCSSGFSRKPISDTCQACPAGKFRLNSSSECADCPRYMKSRSGSTHCECDAEHRGRDCLIQIRAPASPQDRPFLLQLQLDVNITLREVGQNLEQSLEQQVNDFFSIIPAENLTIIEADGRRQQAVGSGTRTINVEAALIRNRDSMVLGLSDIQTDLDEWLGACCRVMYLRALCGAGHQGLATSTNKTLNVSLQDRCEPCALGNYKTSLDSAPCEACPVTRTTRATGAATDRLCVCPLRYITLKDDDSQEVNGTFVCAKPGQISQEQARQVSQTLSLVVGTAIATVVASSVGAAVSSFV